MDFQHNYRMVDHRLISLLIRTTCLETLWMSTRPKSWSSGQDSQPMLWYVETSDIFVVIDLTLNYRCQQQNMGQRYVELASSYTAYGDNSTATLHVSQLPPNPAIIAPGPAYIHVVVNGIPSVGVPVMLGSGKIEKQAVLAVADLPSSNVVGTLPSGSSSSSSSSSHHDSAAQSHFSNSVLLTWTSILLSLVSFVALSSWPMGWWFVWSYCVSRVQSTLADFWTFIYNFLLSESSIDNGYILGLSWILTSISHISFILWFRTVFAFVTAHLCLRICRS